MTDYRAAFGGTEIEPASGWAVEWVDRARGIGRLTNSRSTRLVLVEGAGGKLKRACRNGEDRPL